MYDLEDIKHLHIEITEKCQAACPMCDRNQNGGPDNPHLKNRELYLHNIKRFFPPEFVKQLNGITFCGNYGDPIIATDTLEIAKYFRQHNQQLHFSMNTNGGARPKVWWEELAKTFGKNGSVTFSIDGLEDTNHLYRQNVIWNNIMNAATAFIDAGGRARWDFLIFEHNEHQVDQAKQLANDMGFEKFIPKKTARFFSTMKNKGKEEHQAKNRHGDNTTLIKKPKDEKYLNTALKQEEKIVEKFGSMSDFYDQTPIECKVAKEKSLYISAEGLVLPCCWVGSRLYKWWMKEGEDQTWIFLNKVGGKERLSLHNSSLKEIFDTGFFRDIEKSWKLNSCQEGKALVCAMKCSKKFDTFSAQFKD